MAENQSPASWIKEQSESGPHLKIFNVRFDHLRNPRNGKLGRVVVLESPDAANVVAIDKQQRLLFVRQYRFGIGHYTLELPGGMVDNGEAQEKAICRELREETGAAGGNWTYLGRIPSNPVFQDSYIYHWLAEGISLSETPQLDDEEEIFLEWLTASEAKALLLDGKLEHPHTVNGLMLYFRHINQLR